MRTGTARVVTSHVSHVTTTQMDITAVTMAQGRKYATKVRCPFFGIYVSAIKKV